MGHQPAHLHHQAAGHQEQGRPGRVCARTDQDLARRQLGVVGVEHHAHLAFHHPGRNGAAREHAWTIRFGCGHTLVEGLPVAQQQAWDLLAPRLARVCLALLLYRRNPISVLARGQGLEFGHMQEEQVVRCLQPARVHQPLPALQQGGAHHAHHPDGPELGGFAQPGQGLHPAGRPADQAGLEPPTFHLADLLGQVVGGHFGSGSPPGKDRVGRLPGILDLQVTLQRLGDRRRVLAPAGASQVDLAHTPHPVALQEAGHGALCRLGQASGQKVACQRPGFGRLEAGQGRRIGSDLLGRVPQGQIHLRGHVVWQPPRHRQRVVLAVRQARHQSVQQVERYHPCSKAGDESGQQELERLAQQLLHVVQPFVERGDPRQPGLNVGDHRFGLALEPLPFCIWP